MQSLTKHTAGNFGDTSLATTTKLTIFRRKYTKNTVTLSQQNNNNKGSLAKTHTQHKPIHRLKTF